jgi:hypothetical protein
LLLTRSERRLYPEQAPGAIAPADLAGDGETSWLAGFMQAIKRLSAITAHDLFTGYSCSAAFSQSTRQSE